jgi:hypothetical protein
MRLLHVTDFHFREPWFHWLAAQATNYDESKLASRPNENEGKWEEHFKSSL